MKDSRECSQRVRKLYRALKREYPKPRKIVYDEPLDALVYAVISENISDKAAQSAIKRFNDNFVDLNDLRVSLEEEIIEVLGTDTPVTRNVVSLLTSALNVVFHKCNIVSLKDLKKIGKRPAKHALEQIDGISPFVVNYCMLTSLQGHAIPLTEKMTEYLRSNEMIHSDAQQQQIEGFLVRQISAENAYEFYSLLRCRSESQKTGTSRKTIRKVKASTETVKKEKKAKAKGKKRG